MSYGEFARLTATPLDRAVDRAVDEINDAYLNSDEGRAAMAEHAERSARYNKASRVEGMKPPVRYPDVHVELTGEDSNALMLVSKVAVALKRHLRKTSGLSAAEIEQEASAFRAEALSGDYDKVLQTCMEWVEVE